jgi:Putative porin
MMVELQAQLRELQAKIEQLSAELAEQQGIVAKREPSQDGQVAGSSSAPSSSPSNAPTQQDLQQYTTKVEELGKKVDSTSANLGGFKLSGDFRFRLDGQLRSGNDIAPPLQNVRSRYRVRLNADKELDSRFKFHLQLSTGPYNVGTTNDQDMAGTIAKHPFSIAEAYVDYHPSPLVFSRSGRME